MNKESRFRFIVAPALAAIVLCTAGAFAASAKPLPAGHPRAGEALRREDRDTVTIREGRAVAALIEKKDADTLFAHFDSEMAKAVPLPSIRSVLNAMITIQTPLGTRVTEEASETNGFPVYTASYQWSPGSRLKITVTFDSTDSKRIAGLLLSPDKSPVLAELPDSVQEGVIAAGRSVAALIRKNDSKALEARFTPGMAKAVPKSRIDDTLHGLFSDGTVIGQPISEKVMSGTTADTVTYTGRYNWKKDQAITLNIEFITGSGGKISGLLLRPDVPKTLPPDPHAGYRMKTPLHLPFAPGEEWTVFWGGDTRDQNYHVIAPDQRHAYDIVITRNGSTHEGDGKRLDQYYAYGKTLYAPAAGTIVEAVSDLPDNAIGKTDADHAGGNHILLDLGNGEYVLMAHMQQGSVRVKAGDHVALDQPVGLCGNSGNTSEPHLHIHVQDKPYLFRDALGLPATFVDYTNDGKTVASGAPVRGERIAAIAPASEASVPGR